MSIDLGSEQISINRQRRTYGFRGICNDGTDYCLVLNREVLGKDSSGAIILQDRSLPDVVRYLSQVMNDPDAVMLMQLIKKLGDKWDLEDQAQGV